MQVSTDRTTVSAVISEVAGPWEDDEAGEVMIVDAEVEGQAAWERDGGRGGELELATFSLARKDGSVVVVVKVTKSESVGRSSSEREIETE